MPVSVPMPTKAAGNTLASSDWNSYVRDNLNKLLNSGHRSLTVAQFGALSSPEGTAGTVAGDEVYLIVDATAGVLWHLVYESGETTYKWRFLGGPPLTFSVLAGETTTSAPYVDLATVGPSIIAPRAGDMMVAISFEGTGSAATTVEQASIKIGAAAASDNDRVTWQPGVASSGGTVSALPRKFTVAASDVVKIVYGTNTGTATFSRRNISLFPNRLV